MAVSVAKQEMDYTIKPEAATPAISTADWPLLLKNYEKRTFGIEALSHLSRRWVFQGNGN